MNVHKYVALDATAQNIVAGVYDRKGQQVIQSCIRTNSGDIRKFFKVERYLVQ
ncbi:MAG: hypothetical protein AABN33_29755 [Acidobacteriota bacterium]